MKVKVTRKAHFNAAHRLHNPSWDEAKNNLIFGKCNNPNFHGHNYTLFVSVKGEVDPDTGYVIDLGVLRDLVETEIVSYLDHKNLNLDIPEFQSLNPTVENINLFIFNTLRNRIDPRYSLSVTVYETENNYSEVSDD